MARNGVKTGGRDFVKGHPGGPGAPKLPLDVKESRQLNRVEFERRLNKYLHCDAKELEAVIRSKELPMIDLVVAKVVLKAFNEGDTRRLDFVLMHLLGAKPPIPVVPAFQPEVQKLSFSEFCANAKYPSPYPKQIEMVDFVFNQTDPRLLLGARGYGKTDYPTIMGTAYDIYLNGVETSNLIISKSKTRNTAIIEEIANALTANGVALDKQNASVIRVAGLIGKEESVEALTIKSSFRGRHPKRIVMDDPVTEEDTSEAMRILVKKKYDEAYKLCKNIAIIGQPAHAFDLYAELRPILLKMEVPHGTIPELDADLEAMRLAGIDQNSIEMSFHLRVPSSGSSTFSNLKFIDQMPDGPTVAFIDPSDGGDYTATSVGRGYFDGLAVEGKAWKKAWYHCLDEMVAYFKERNVQRICFETNATGTQPLLQLRQIFKPLGVGVVGVHSESNKQAVIEAAGSYSHLIHLSKRSDKIYTDQVVKYAYDSKFDDSPDSLARLLEWMGLIRGRKPKG